MSSPQTETMTSNSNTNLVHWVHKIGQMLEVELEDKNPVCIFSVPKTLMSSKPDSYIPQQVALGPYHCLRPDLYMKRYKLAAAKRTQNHLQSRKFQQLVRHFENLVPTILAYYHKCLDFNSETLACVMAVDASFLLEFLQSYSIKEETSSSEMSSLIDSKSIHNAILRDIAMLENQIPLFLLREILKFQPSSSEIKAEGDELSSMLMGLYRELSPFKTMKGLPSIQVTKHAHLLDFLYYMIVPKSEENSKKEVETVLEFHDNQNEPVHNKKESSSRRVKPVFSKIGKFLPYIRQVSFIKKVLESSEVKFLFDFLECISSNKCFTGDKEDIKPDQASSSTDKINKPPLIEAITIPSVTKLYNSGIRFLPTEGSINTINFNQETCTLYLPTISLDVNTEVILRNLVAYETSIASGPLAFTRYTELMNGIIVIEEDAKLLRKSRIVLNHLKSYAEVANLWNGMSKSVRLTNVQFLDKAIEDVNKYYSGRWKVKAKKYMKIYVLSSWQILTFLAAILLLLLTTLDAFCSVYSCGRISYLKIIQ